MTFYTIIKNNYIISHSLKALWSTWIEYNNFAIFFSATNNNHSNFNNINQFI